MKVCSKCGIEKDLVEFNKKSASKDGKRSACKDCQKQYNKQYRKDNRVLIAKNMKQYMKQYNKDHPEMRRKHARNNRSMRSGWLPPLPINEHFENSELHHMHLLIDGEIDHRIAVFIPRKIHRSVWHSNNIQSTMDEINKLAMEWYYKYGYKL